MRATIALGTATTSAWTSLGARHAKPDCTKHPRPISTWTFAQKPADRKATERNRTVNLQITNQVLCQLSYGGVPDRRC